MFGGMVPARSSRFLLDDHYFILVMETVMDSLVKNKSEYQFFSKKYSYLPKSVASYATLQELNSYIRSLKVLLPEHAWCRLYALGDNSLEMFISTSCLDKATMQRFLSNHICNNSYF